ncbi:MAG: pyridoxal phosphate-dependent aminotransferase [Bacteroidia bacterium]|nr:pyridoxal phosphate-dependent aminotransferase [Bacteroidia bacterium]MDW8301339.1 pyridoxal phosphate-dependent aminotransferase [Bacteroidia bacterium]
MPNISQRAVALPASPIRKLVPFAEKAKKMGKKVYHLNIGQPDVQTPETFWKAIQNHNLKVLEYTHSAGMESYRKKLSQYYQKHDIFVSYEDIIITVGGSEALFFAMYTCMNPNEEIIIPEPFYTNYNAFAQIAGVKVVPVPSRIEEGFKLPPISEFEQRITDKTKAILIANPGNPTGYIYTREELEQLKQLVLKYDLFLISDEVYREFIYDDKPYVSVMHLSGIEDRTILVDSVSKRYSACGARIGALVCKNKEIIQSALKMGQARLCAPMLEQIACEAAVDTPQSYFDAVTQDYVARRNVVLEGLSRIPNVIYNVPSGAFYLMAKFPIESSEHFCQWLLENFEYNNETVMLAPAGGFYATPGAGKSEVRIAYVLEVNELKKAMVCLQKGLEQYLQQSFSINL